jgi:hypothetical protein
LSPLVVTISTRLAAPVVAAMRLRGGNAGSARGAASLLTHALVTAKAPGATGMILVRADSAYYAGAVISAARRAGAMFSGHRGGQHRDPRRNRDHLAGRVGRGAVSGCGARPAIPAS